MQPILNKYAQFRKRQTHCAHFVSNALRHAIYDLTQHGKVNCF